MTESYSISLAKSYGGTRTPVAIHVKSPAFWGGRLSGFPILITEYIRTSATAQQVPNARLPVGSGSILIIQ